MYATNRPAAAQYGRYQQQSAMTASPGELTLMLYDGCVKFLKQARYYLEEKELDKSNQVSIKAQNIISELMATLDMKYEISTNLFSLYSFILRLVVQSNLKKDPALLEEPINMMSELRDTWQQAVKLSRQQSAGVSYE